MQRDQIEPCSLPRRKTCDERIQALDIIVNILIFEREEIKERITLRLKVKVRQIVFNGSEIFLADHVGIGV